MARKSAGVLLYRRCKGGIEVFLVHHGGPFWTKKDFGAWSIPKGEFGPDDDPFKTAKREFEEETGFSVEGEFVLLTPIKQAGGKIVHAWAVEGDCDPSVITSNTFSMEWPPCSGKYQSFPEVDRAGWFTIEEAKEKINKGQIPFIEELLQTLKRR